MALLGQWIGAMRRFAWLVLGVAAVATGGVLYYTVENITINTDTSALISNDLPFRRQYLDYKKAFPQFAGSLVVVIDGASPDAADEAAAALTRRLAEDTKRFSSVFYPQGELFFRRNGLLYLDLDELKTISDRLADAQPLLTSLAADMSLRGLFGVLGLALGEAAKGNVNLAGLDPVLANIGVALDARLADRRYRMSWVELLRGEKADAEDRRRVVLAQSKSDWDSLKPDAAAMDAVRAAGRSLNIDADNDLRLRLTGSAAIDTEELESVEAGAGTAGLITVGLVLALLFVGLRSLRQVAATLITLFVGLIWTAGFAIAAIGHLNMISVAFAVLFIGLAVDFSIHFVLRYQEERFKEHAARKPALITAAYGVGRALTLSAVCAALAFFSFVPTAYLGIAELGMISGMGMFFALIANFTLLPAILTVLPGQAHVPEEKTLDLVISGAIARRIDAFVHSYARPVVYGGLALGAGAAVLATTIDFDLDPLSLKDPKQESVQTVLELMESPRYTPDTLSVLMPDLDSAVDLAKRLKTLPEVGAAVTVRDFVPKGQEQKLGIIENMALFMAPLLLPDETKPSPGAPENRAALDAFGRHLDRLVARKVTAFRTDIAALAQRVRAFQAYLDENPASAGEALDALETSLLAYLPGRIEDLKLSLEAGPVTVADLPAGIRDRQIAADGRVRVEVIPAHSLQENGARRQFVTAVRTIAPNATDNSVLLLESADAIVGAFQQATLTAAVLILLLLAVLLRDLWQIALVLVPIALAAAYTLGAAVILGMSLNFANIIAIPLLLGLGVASAIHLVVRSRRLEKRLGDGSDRVFQTSTPRAVLFSALTTIGSFGSLAISSHRGTASMGMLLTLSLAMTLLCALVFLPALMHLRDHPPGADQR